MVWGVAKFAQSLKKQNDTLVDDTGCHLRCERVFLTGSILCKAEEEYLLV